MPSWRRVGGRRYREEGLDLHWKIFALRLVAALNVDYRAIRRPSVDLMVYVFSVNHLIMRWQFADSDFLLIAMLILHHLHLWTALHPIALSLFLLLMIPVTSWNFSRLVLSSLLMPLKCLRKTYIVPFTKSLVVFPCLGGI